MKTKMRPTTPILLLACTFLAFGYTTDFNEGISKIYLQGDMLVRSQPGKSIDFHDLSNPAAVRQVGSLSIVGNSDIAVEGNYLYADRNHDLVIYDISDPSAAKIVGTQLSVFKTSGALRVEAFNQFNNGGGNSFGGANGCAAQGCDASTDSDNQGFGTGPGNDRFGSGTNPIYTNNATSNGSNGGTSSGSGFPGSSSGNNNVDVPRDGTGGSLARFLVVANRLYCIDNENLIVFDISDPSSPKNLGTTEVAEMIETIFYANAHLFIAGRKGLQIYDVDDNKMPQYRGEFDHAERCDPVYVDGNRAYVTLRGENECGGWTNQVDILDISNIQNPLLISSYTKVNSPFGLAVKNGTAFVCDGKSGLRVLDVSDPHRVKECRRYSDVEAIDVIWHKNLLIVNTGKGFYLYDASSPCKLKEYGLLF